MDGMIDELPRLTVADIKAAVCAHFGTRPLAMRSPRRALSVTRPRQVAMYLAYEMTALTLPQIGRLFDRDHTTVLHATRVIPALMARDTAFAADVSAIAARLRNDDPNQLQLPLQAA